MTASAWLATLRVRTLPAAAAPILVGIAYAWRIDAFVLLPAMAAFVAALLLQIGTNLANDYYDHVKGADTADRAGPVRASASGLLPPTAVRNAAFGTFTAAAIVGLYLIWVGGWPVLLIGTLAILSGIFYTAGKWAIAYIGLGELFVFVFFGPVFVAGTVYVQSLSWEVGAILWGIPLGLLSSAILVVNNLRDIPTDAAAGKRTLAVRLGEKGTRTFYVTLVTLAFAAPPVIGHLEQDVFLLLPLLALPLALPPARRVLAKLPDRRDLNPALGSTARLLLAYGVLAAIALLR